VGLAIQSCCNDLNNAVQVRKHIIVPKADHSISLALKICRSLLVGSIVRVLSTIDFDYQALSRHMKSQMNGPTGIWRENLKP
jgi:hypothetical protein